jgi:hypothetical protein
MPSLASSALRALIATVVVLLLASFFSWALIHDELSPPLPFELALAPIYGLLWLAKAFRIDITAWPEAASVPIFVTAQYLYFFLVIHGFRLVRRVLGKFGGNLRN